MYDISPPRLQGTEERRVRRTSPYLVGSGGRRSATSPPQLDSHKELVFGETDLRGGGVFVGGRAVAEGGDDGGGVALGFEAEDVVVLRAVEAFHGAGINAQQRGAGEENAEGDVGLVARPGVAAGFIPALDESAHEHVAERLKRSRRCAGGFDDVADVRIDVGLTEIVFGGEDDEVGGVGDLFLAVAGGQQFGAHGGVGHDDEFPRLHAAAGRREGQRGFERGPIGVADLAVGIKLFSGITPVELFEELLGIDGAHGWLVVRSWELGVGDWLLVVKKVTRRRRVAGRVVGLVQVEQKDLRRFGRFDVELIFAVDGGSVAAGKRFAVQHDFAFGDVEPGVAVGGERLRDLLAGVEPGDPQIGVLVDGDGAIASGFAGDEVELARGRVAEGFLGVARFDAFGIGRDPDLEEVRGFGLRGVGFTMAHAAAGGHVLDFAGANDAAVAHGVFVLERAAEDVGNDLHVLVRVRAKAHAGHDEVVINDAETAVTHPLGVIVVREAEGVIGVEPAVFGMAAFVGFKYCHHGKSLAQGRGVAEIPCYWGEYSFKLYCEIGVGFCAERSEVEANRRIVNKFFRPEGVRKKDTIGSLVRAGYSTASVCKSLERRKDVRRQDEVARRFPLIIFEY